MSVSSGVSAQRVHSFSAQVVEGGMFPCVVVPATVSKALGAKGNVPVVGIVAGRASLRGTLVPRGEGHRLYLNTALREEAGIELGDRVKIEIRIDHEPRGVDLPRDFADALREADLRAAFDERPPGWRDQILKYVAQPKSDDARERRIAKTIERIAAEAEKRADARAAKEAKEAKEAKRATDAKRAAPVTASSEPSPTRARPPRPRR